MKRFTLSCLLVVCVPSFVFAQGDAKKDPPKKFVVPFELIKTQHMVVSVKVNGKGPYRLVFDTGAPDSLLSTKVAKEAEVFDKDHKRPFFALFGSMGQAKVKEIQLGDLKAEKITATVLDHPTVDAIAKFVGPIEGILGFTFYARYKMSIDYEKLQITFEENSYEPGDVMKVMMDKMIARSSSKQAAPVIAPAGLIGIRVEKAKDDAAGVLVKDVIADSPAAAAGFKVGDRLLTLDGRWTDNVNDCYAAAGQVKIGTPVTAQVLRNGKKMSLKLTLRAGL
jgi:PDZ domain-containing protein/aspartyl protease